MSNKEVAQTASLDRNTQLLLLRTMWRSRLGDLREQSLIRQGKGWFHISGMGHEAFAAIALSLEEQDYAFPYYRDRSFCLQRGVSDRDLALVYHAKRDSSSGGRQLPGHFSDRALNIWSLGSPVASHLLPACGVAWGMQLDGKQSVVYASTGEASTRQGDFFEAVCFAKERNLPLVLAVQDNRIAISTETEQTNPLSLGALNPEDWIQLDGSNPEVLAEAGRLAVEKARAGEGPSFLWCRVERLSSHSSADDQRRYRNDETLNGLEQADPVLSYEAQLIRDGVIDEGEARALEESIREEIRETYLLAARSEDPRPEETSLHLAADISTAVAPNLELAPTCRMLDAANQVFHHAIDTVSDVVFFGQDIADPKGGVFNLTAGLSTKDPSRAVNAPVAESTILGVAVGLASYGKRPCFEIQFIDFIFPGWNQLVSNISTLSWRSFGQWQCPLILYAPCGAYLPGGALWHSQSTEGSLASIPGVQVAMPSTPEDVAGLFWTALEGRSPTILLLPKHLMWAEQPTSGRVPGIPFGKARIIQEGGLLTLVTWGNCVELVEKTLDEMDTELDVERIDLRSMSPWDREQIGASIQKTGRLLVVQEDNRTGSLGQSILAEMCADPEVLQSFKSPPVLVSKEDVHIGFNPLYEYAALPDASRVEAAIHTVLGSALKASLQNVKPVPVVSSELGEPAVNGTMETSKRTINVPILGEGIRTARLVSILKQSSDPVRPDDSLCEVETDKAVFPIESDVEGVLETWLVEDGETVSVGQPLVELGQVPIAPDTHIPFTEERVPVETNVSPDTALSLEAMKLMEGIIPATIEMDCRWDSVRDARLRSKETPGGTLSTSAMVAWSVIRAMTRHEQFASYTVDGRLERYSDHFDLGVAVSLPGDKLETAVLQDAEALEWDAFPEQFNQALRAIRHGEKVSKNRVSLILSSMGSYRVRSAIPVVIPPSVATLFIGAPSKVPDPEGAVGSLMETVSLVLTFDHRWINGAGAAAFLSDVRRGIERFDLA
ncbi:MAG: thiamine pyrophosphate-dependent enzyme [Coraliomargaritaceae bacterium]